MVSYGVHVDGRMFSYSVDDESNFWIRGEASLLEWAKFTFSTALDHISFLALSRDFSKSLLNTMIYLKIVTKRSLSLSLFFFRFVYFGFS